jgi:Protein of unknown function (DUF2510)
MWRSTWVILGVLVGFIGAIFFIGNGGNHSTCSSILLAGNSACNSINDRYYGGIVAIVVGVALLIVGAASGSRSNSNSAPDSATASPWPPGWYVDRKDPTTERWWNGAAWTEYSRPKPTAPDLPVS